MANQIKFLLLSISFLSAYGDVFVSIDCGASGTYTDENLIVWMGDNNLIQNGITEVVQSSDSVSQVMDTLRVFTSRKKNCYSISADDGGQVLVRASFNYGNYDKKASPPTFDLQFDGNFWATVQTTNSGVVYYEAIYVVKGNETSICVAQTNPNQLPFLSALEVRSLDPQMYSQVDKSNYALFSRIRSSYGTNETIRYSDDPYDRIWVPAKVGSGLVNVTSDEIFINVDVPENPPQAVLQTAITAANRTTGITLGTDAQTVSIPVYMIWYFSEVMELNSTEMRSFRIFEDGQPFSLPIVPPYGNVTEFYVSNHTVSSNTTFALFATGDSTLPPLINAMEVYEISSALTNGTNSNDVEGLVSLQNAFSVLQEWSSDPCLPAPYSWDWINCSTDTTPRVTALDLSNFSLVGSLPDFSSMDALQIIDLHDNSLTGPIPDFLGSLPNLQQLNLADNQFSGSIPTSLSKNSKLNLNVAGNPLLCSSGKSCQVSSNSTDKKKSSKLPAILGSIIPIFIIFWAAVGVYVIWQKRKTAAVAVAGHQMAGGLSPNAHPQQNSTNVEMLAKVGEGLIDVLRVNIEEQQAAQGVQNNGGTSF